MTKNYGTHDVTKRDFLVFIDGMGVYFNILFARRHGIVEGSHVSRKFSDLHFEEVPPMESVTHHIWRVEEDTDDKLRGFY